MRRTAAPTPRVPRLLAQASLIVLAALVARLLITERSSDEFGLILAVTGVLAGATALTAALVLRGHSRLPLAAGIPTLLLALVTGLSVGGALLPAPVLAFVAATWRASTGERPHRVPRPAHP